MSKHEIRLRRQKFARHGSERFRNYGAVLQQHEAAKRMKKILRAFTYFLIILILIALFVIVSRVEKKAEEKLVPGKVSYNHKSSKFMVSRADIPNLSIIDCHLPVRLPKTLLPG